MAWGWCCGSGLQNGEPVCWAADGRRPPVQNVGIDHRRAHIIVTQPFLCGPDIVPVFFEEACGKIGGYCGRIESRRLKTVERLGPAGRDELEGAALGIHGEILRWIMGRFRPASLELWGN
jgi:hypothetical protein